MRARNDLTFEQVSALLNYNPGTGELTWLVSPNPSTKVGDVAGWREPNGYIRIRINGVGYGAHRLAFLLARERWPRAQVDHINGDRADNRAHNLREATRFENQQNHGRHKNNTTGYPGVCHRRSLTLPFRADIQFKGKHYFLGNYATAIAAASAYACAKRRLHTFAPEVRGAYAGD